jgi:hypothetical protein
VGAIAASAFADVSSIAPAATRVAREPPINSILLDNIAFLPKFAGKPLTIRMTLGGWRSLDLLQSVAEAGGDE